MRNFQIFEHRQLIVDRWRLKFPPDTQTGNLVLHQLCDVGIFKKDLATSRLCLSTDHIEQGRLARTVRADHAMQRVWFQIEVETIDRFEAVERHGQVFNLENKFV